MDFVNRAFLEMRWTTLETLCQGPAEDSPEVSIYNTIHLKWAEKNKCDRLTKASFDDLEHRLMRQFFLRAVNGLTKYKSHFDFSEEPVDPSIIIISLLSQARMVVKALTKVAKHHPVQDDHQQLECSAGSDQQDATSRPATSIVVPEPYRRFPALPPEIVKEILSYVAADELKSKYDYPKTSPTTLFSCALVNKSWSSLGRQALYRRLKLRNVGSMYNFAFPRLWSARLAAGMVPTLPGLEIHTFIQELKLSNLDQSDVWTAVLHTLYLFPNLRRLQLKDIRGIHELQPLFDQTLPSLQKLSLQGYSTSTAWDWEGGASYNREQARAFFSRLMGLKFSYNCKMETDVRRCPQFVDTAHEDLRSIKLPDDTPAHITTQFLAKCSDALVAVDTSSAHLSWGTFETLATTCRGLRALAVGNTDIVDVDGLVSLIEKCGPRLLCLELISEDRRSIPRTVLRSVIRHCRSLEALRLEFEGKRVEVDCLELVSTLGRKFKQLDLYMTTFDVHANTLIDRIADHCPNLRHLGIPYTVELYVPNPPQEQQEGEEAQQPQPQQGITDVMGCEVLEQTFAKLLQKCPNIQTLHPFEDFDYSRFTDPELQAAVISLVDCHQLTKQFRHYFDPTFYSGRSSSM
ncbi:hypothetical protein HK102_003022 [Quaeritorhiza haematococci]|nr:hypothetical protein HK102_003022 [Quaeritorhiza haematococci]